MLVLKFGGSSVGSAENIKRVERIVRDKKQPAIIVVSAFKGVTNLLDEISVNSKKRTFDNLFQSLKSRHQEIVNELEMSDNRELVEALRLCFDQLLTRCYAARCLGELSPKSKAFILSTGEQLSALIITAYFSKFIGPVHCVDPKRIIFGNLNYLNLEVNFEVSNKAIQSHFTENCCYVVPGFTGKAIDGNTAVLGRGGSDYTASIIAAALDAKEVEIWSDVDGMLRADPAIVKNPEVIPEISYEEALELSHFGAKVLYPPAVFPAQKNGIAVRLLNTFNPQSAGTRVANFGANNNELVAGISAMKNMALLVCSGIALRGAIGIVARFFNALSEAEINISFISQSCAEQSICIGIKSIEISRAERAYNKAFDKEIKLGLLLPLKIDAKVAIIAVVGQKLKEKSSVKSLIFSALSRNNIHAMAVAQSASDLNFSIAVSDQNQHKSIEILHETLFRQSSKEINIFLIGTGNVGKAFKKLIENNAAEIEKQLGIKFCIRALVNSRQMSFISSKNNRFAAQTADLEEFLVKLNRFNFKNKVVVDCTASDAVAALYERLLLTGNNVVTCNKIALSGQQVYYDKLIKAARKSSVGFRFETCVGAALPVINTIDELRLSGDRITKMEAVLSGSLNFIFNNYNTKDHFADIVLRAREEGYTEPDPMLDLSGKDVVRKLLILARTSGFDLESENIETIDFLPKSIERNLSWPDLYLDLKKAEPHFREIWEKANQKGCKLKMVASFEVGTNNLKPLCLTVGLKEIPAHHPFFELNGKDNIITISTLRYNDHPLVIKGAGAGAELTASGVFSDIIRIFNN